MIRLSTVLLLLVWATPSKLHSQSPERFDSAFATLHGMERLRVFSRNETATGKFLGASNGSLLLATTSGHQQRFIQSEIDSVSLGISRGKALALNAGLFGALAVGTLGGIVHASVSDDGGVPVGGVVIGALTGAALGGLVGLIVGQSSTHWLVIYSQP
jgi:hypothetical protein